MTMRTTGGRGLRVAVDVPTDPLTVTACLEDVRQAMRAREAAYATYRDATAVVETAADAAGQANLAVSAAENALTGAKLALFGALRAEIETTR